MQRVNPIQKKKTFSLATGGNMTIKVYAILTNCGDGSSCIRWFNDRYVTEEDLEALEENDPETWGSGDGLQCTTLTFPDDFDFEEAGISFSSYEEAFANSVARF